MKKFLFEHAYTPSGWKNNLLVETDISGQITSLIAQEKYEHADAILRPGYALPSFVNGHSHAFQYEMVGLTENLPAGSNGDDFWSWRTRMYNLALTLQPEDIYEISLALYTRMLKRGYGCVAEFHYLHHQPNGDPYPQKSYMAEALMAAAQEAGIDLCLVPIWYAKGGFGKPALPKQRRFLSRTYREYMELYESTLQTAQQFDHCFVGMGIHSLRAVDPKDICTFFDVAPADIPIHIHIAEQEQEIHDCIQYLGKRPIEWLLDNVEHTSNLQLVHATHMTPAECTALASSDATVVICPSTEANLGDGLFPLMEYHRKGGKWCIGTDSHVGLDPLLELQLLEYGQRLYHRKRNVLCNQEGDDTGTILFDHAHRCGAKSVGASQRGFILGAPLSAVVYPDVYPICSAKEDQRIASLIFGSEPHSPAGIQQRHRWITM